jgi:hypothetical protein
VSAEDFESVDRTDIGDEDVPDLIGDGYVLKVESTADGETSIETVVTDVADGSFITASFYAATSSTTPVVLDFTISAIDAESDELIEGVTSSTEISLTNEWTRFSTTMFISSSLANSIDVNLTISGDTDSEILYFDRAQIESSFKATDYFSGSDVVGEASAESAFWEGGRWNSPSHQYANFDQKIDRLMEQLPNYLPTNLSFLVRWQGGGVAKPSF